LHEPSAATASVRVCQRTMNTTQHGSS